MKKENDVQVVEVNNEFQSNFIVEESVTVKLKKIRKHRTNSFITRKYRHPMVRQ